MGFPGETEKEFEELCEFVREAKFDWMGAFGYSDQEGAGAFGIESKLSGREIERRRKHLMQIQKRISKKNKKALVGKEVRFAARRHVRRKRSVCSKAARRCTLPEIDGKVFVNDVREGLEPKEGEFYRCQITEAHDYDLVAKIV